MVVNRKNANDSHTASEDRNPREPADASPFAVAAGAATMSSATYASVRRRSHSSASTAAPTAAAPKPAMCQPATLVRPAMNSGATAQPRLPDTPCTENACPRRGWLTRWLISVKSAGWNMQLPTPATAALSNSIG